MRRRKFTIGLGALAAGSAAAVGTGAFTSVEAERDLTVEVSGEADAFLGMEPHPSSPNAQYASTSGTNDLVEIDFTSNDLASDTGLNDNANTNIEDVLQITNNGTQDVYVNVAIEDSAGNIGGDVADGLEVGLSGDEGNDIARLGPDYDGELISPGTSVGLGFFFLASGEDFGDVVDDIETMYVVAAADGELPAPEDL